MARKIPTLPNLLIIGASKAGTTSLHDYLSRHPEIHMSENKELAFFDPRLRWNLGVDWYKANFDAAYRINGESSPQYTTYPIVPDVPRRIKEVLGAPKFIYLLRDPVDRLLSQYTQVLDDFPGARSFSEILPNIENEDAGYIQKSSYFLQLNEYLQLFPRDSILVVINERLAARPRETLRAVFRFIGVDETFWSAELEAYRNVGGEKRQTAAWFDNHAPSFLKTYLRSEPTVLPWKVKEAVRSVSRLGGTVTRKPKLASQDDLRLQQLLRADVTALRHFLGDPLPEWRPYA